MPHSDCGNYDLYEDYATARGPGLAIKKSHLLPLKARPGTQPCDVFGLNPVMRNLQRLYDQGDAAMLANVGPLVEPITKQEFTEKTKQRPPLLFAHNTQQQIVASVHAQYNYAEGVVGASGVVEARRTHHLPMHYCRSSLCRVICFGIFILHILSLYITSVSIRPHCKIVGPWQTDVALQNGSLLSCGETKNVGR